MKPRKVLVVAAHPDDEVLGCGGAIARHASNGDEVHVLILAEGLTSRDIIRNRDKHTEGLDVLAQAARKANGILGVKNLDLHDFPDNRMDSLDLLDVVKVVESFVARFQPDVVYTHHAGDLNIDHRIIHEAVVTACRPLPKQCVRTLLLFEVVSSTEWQVSGSTTSFIPNCFVDITKTLDLKMEALEAYDSEMKAWPHPRSREAIIHLARWRGCTVGLEAAEAFILGRQVVR